MTYFKVTERYVEYFLWLMSGINRKNFSIEINSLIRNICLHRYIKHKKLYYYKNKNIWKKNCNILLNKQERKRILLISDYYIWFLFHIFLSNVPYNILYWLWQKGGGLFFVDAISYWYFFMGFLHKYNLNYFI